MTEAERIIRAGIVPSDYLKEEVRDDFLVTTERKKIYAVLLDMLLKVDSVCKKYDLTYFLCAGTLLGAVRHKGFIPWDDDIDLLMPRKDYNILMNLSKEFEQPYFLQTPYTDPTCFWSSMRIRNSNTTQIINAFMYQGFNQGISLTIFPLDYWDENGGEERYALLKKLIQKNSTYMRMTNPDLDEASKKRVAEYDGSDPLKTYEEIQRIASEANARKTGKMGFATCTVWDYGPTRFKDASYFSSSILADFEGYQFPIPIGYKEILTMNYGDYMQFPPMEKRGKWHAGMYQNPDISYTEYLKQKGIVVDN